MEGEIDMFDEISCKTRKRFLNLKRPPYTAIILIIITFAIIVRVFKLEILDPYTDEYLHIIAAMEIMKSGHTDYTRCYFLTYITYIMFKFLGQDLFIARLPSVLFGVLTIIPLYLLASKISRPIGLASAFLWASSPWAIGVSRTVREYAVFPFFLLIFLYILVDLSERITLLIEQKRYPGKTEAFAVLIVSIFLSYALVDYQSTFKFEIFLIPPIILLLLYKVPVIRSYAKMHAKLGLSFVVITSAIILISMRNVFVNFWPPDIFWVNLILDPNGPVYKGATAELFPWYPDLSFVVFIPTILVLSGAYFALHEKNRNCLIILIIFFISYYCIYVPFRAIFQAKIHILYFAFLFYNDKRRDFLYI